MPKKKNVKHKSPMARTRKKRWDTKVRGGPIRKYTANDTVVVAPESITEAEPNDKYRPEPIDRKNVSQRHRDKPFVKEIECFFVDRAGRKSSIKVEVETSPRKEKDRVKSHHLNEINELASSLGREHLIDALHVINVLNKQTRTNCNIERVLESLTRRQANAVIKLLKRIASGKVEWLRVNGIPGRKPTQQKRTHQKSFVYFISDNNGGVKIGKAVNVENRLKGLQTGSSTKLELLAAVPGGYKKERMYQTKFQHLLLHGEWFRLTDEIMSEINEINGWA